MKFILPLNIKPNAYKALRQAIMKRSRLKNRANKTKDPTGIRNYKKQWNIVNLNKEAKVECFSKYESNDNKTFVNFKPYFTNEHSKANTDICLVKMEN